MSIFIDVHQKRGLKLFLNKLWKIFRLFLLPVLFVVFFVIRYEYYIDSSGLLSSFGFKFENLVIQGYKNAEINSILSTIDNEKGDDIFSIDLVNIYKKLIVHEWIKFCTISRKLPDTIHINIIEKNPIARWQHKQKLALIDEDGKIISSNNLHIFSELLHVTGNCANIYARNLINIINRYPNVRNRVTAATMCGCRRWNLIIDNIVMKMPEKDIERGIAMIPDVLDNVIATKTNVKVIDMSDTNKIYIEPHL